MDYKLTDTGITFYKDGIIMFDCPAERIAQNPQDAIIAMKLLVSIWREKVEGTERGA